MSQEHILDEKKAKIRKPELAEPAQTHEGGPGPESAAMLGLQQRVGNRAVQRLMAQRSGGDSAFQLDDETAGRINGARGGGQALDGGTQQQMGAAMGQDFSGVRVHTSNESHTLNQQLNAKAFTTGQDIFFKQGEYNPGSSGGQELLAHELTHVVQQSTGRVGGGSGMTVNAPGDTFEQEADAVAKQAVTAGSAATTERPAGGVQREEELQMKSVQREEMPEEEELQTKAVQREEMLEEEEELQTKAVQREEIPEEEEVE